MVCRTMSKPIGRTVQQEEKRASQRLRALQKAQAARAKQVERLHRREDRQRDRYRAWLKRESAAFALHVALPDDDKLRRAWLRTWRDCP
jgi:hypothetical protein